MFKLTITLLIICGLGAGCRVAREESAPSSAVASPTPDAGPGANIRLPPTLDAVTAQLYRQGRGVVPLDRKFRNGDGLRLQITAAEDGYFYVLVKESEGSCAVLLPHPKATPGSNRARRHQQITLPDPGWFRFRNQAGTETVYLVFSRTEERPLNRLTTKPGDAAAEVAWLEGQLAGAAGLVFDADTLVKVIRLEHE